MTISLPRKNDLITWAFLVSTIGFLLVMVAGLAFKHLVIRKFGTNSPELVQYYYWIFPLGIRPYDLLRYLKLMHGACTNPSLQIFLKEIQWRVFTTILIVLFISNIIPNYDLFIKLYAFTYPGIALILFLWLLLAGKIHFTFKISKVTRRFLE